jgi:hypothetical protein
MNNLRQVHRPAAQAHAEMRIPCANATLTSFDGTRVERKIPVDSRILAITPQRGRTYFLPEVQIKDDRPKEGQTMAIYNLPLLENRLTEEQGEEIEWYVGAASAHLAESLGLSAVGENTAWSVKYYLNPYHILIGRVEMFLSTDHFYRSGAPLDVVMDIGNGIRRSERFRDAIVPFALVKDDINLKMGLRNDLKGCRSQ